MNDWNESTTKSGQVTSKIEVFRGEDGRDSASRLCLELHVLSCRVHVYIVQQYEM